MENHLCDLSVIPAGCWVLAVIAVGINKRRRRSLFVFQDRCCPFEPRAGNGINLTGRRFVSHLWSGLMRSHKAGRAEAR